MQHFDGSWRTANAEMLEIGAQHSIRYAGLQTSMHFYRELVGLLHSPRNVQLVQLGVQQMDVVVLVCVIDSVVTTAAVLASQAEAIVCTVCSLTNRARQ